MMKTDIKSNYCKACGHLSPKEQNFTLIKGITFCIWCANNYANGVAPEKTWVKKALER